MNTQLQENPRGTVKNLVHILNDGQWGFSQAAENMQNPQLKEVFNRFALQRARFAEELSTQLAILDGSDDHEESGTVSGAVHRGWINLKSALTNRDDHAVLSEAERGEDVTKEAYEKALTHDLTPALRSVLVRQAEQVRAAHDEVKRLRDATKKS